MDNLSSVAIFILSAGYGSRMREVTGDAIPKGLVEVDSGKRLLNYPLDVICNSSFTRLIICVGHLGNLIREHFHDEYNGLPLSYAHVEPTGVMSSIKQALVDNLPESNFGIMWGDEIYERLSLDLMYRFHIQRGVSATVLATINSSSNKTDSIVIDSDGMVTEYCQGKITEALGSLGMYFLNRELVNEILLQNTWEEFINSFIQRHGLSAYISDVNAWNINSVRSIQAFLSHDRSATKNEMHMH